MLIPSWPLHVSPWSLEPFPGPQSPICKGETCVLSKDPSSSDLWGFDEQLLVISLFPDRFDANGLLRIP